MAKELDRKTFLLEASSGRLMVSLSLPAIVGMVVIGLYTFVDAIYAGQLISTDAMGGCFRCIPLHFHQYRHSLLDRHGFGLGVIPCHRRRPAGDH